MPGSSGAGVRAGVRRSAPIFAALGDETRLRIVVRLSRDGPLSIAELTADERVTRQAVTKHLQRLASAGVLRSRRFGRERRWEVEPAALDVAENHLRAISAEWDAALARLKAFVER
jgi:DNA-binding transcriptional ArsR family regulator